jgi:hypothetical protein
MFDGFTLDRIDVGDTVLRVRHGGAQRSARAALENSERPAAEVSEPPGNYPAAAGAVTRQEP